MKVKICFIIIVVMLCGCISGEDDILESEGTLVYTDVNESGGNEWHYYLRYDGLYRINKITADIVRINGQDYTSDMIRTGDWMYYNDNNCLYRINSENRRELLLYDVCRNLVLANGYLYYSNKNGVFRVKPDGSNKERIIQCNCAGMVLVKGSVFYTEFKPTEEIEGYDDGPKGALGQLHKANIDGSNDVNLRILVNYLCAYKSVVYFSNVDDYYFYSMDPDTTETSAIYEGHFIDEPCFAGDLLYFVSDRNLCRLSLSTNVFERFTEIAWPRCNGVLDGYVYITTYQDTELHSPGLYRMRESGVIFEKVDSIEFG